MKESPWLHPDPGVLMPVPRDMEVSPSNDPDDFERMSEKDAAVSLGKTQKPRHEDNRGQEASQGGRRPGE